MSKFVTADVSRFQTDSLLLITECENLKIKYFDCTVIEDWNDAVFCSVIFISVWI